MENTDRLKKSPSGSEGHGIHVCNKCGWPFPNPRPSAKLKKAHKRVCGTIEGYKIGDSKACLDVSGDEHLSDNDSKTLNTGLETVEKAAEMAVSSRSFSGIGSGSNRSTRSEDDMFSDAVTDFGDASGVSESDDVRESAKKQEISEDDRVSKAIADAGGSDIQLQTVDYSRPEKGKVDIDMPSQYHLSSSTLNGSSNSGLSNTEEESLGTENMLRSSDISAVLDSDEKGSRMDEESEDLTSVPTEKAGITSKAEWLPQKVNGDSLEYVLVPEDAAMEVIGKESDAFGEKNDSFPKDNSDTQLNSLENSSEAAEDENVKAGSFHVLVVADETPLREHSKVLPEKLPAAATLDPAPEVECLGLGEAFVTQDTLSNLSLAEPNESDDKTSNDMISEALYQEVNVERKSEENDTVAGDACVSGSNSVVLHPDKDINESGQGKSVVTEEQNPLVFADTSLPSVKDESGIHTHYIKSVKPDHDDSERDNEDAEFSDALEADSAKVEEVESPLTNETSFAYNICVTMEKKLLEGGNGDDYDVRSTESEKLSAATPSVPEFEGQMDDKVEVERKYGHVLEVQDSEAAVKDLGSPSEQIVVGESADAVVASAIVSVGNEANVVEQTYNDEDCVQKASEFVDVILSKKVKDDDVQPEKIEISGVKDVGDKMSGDECIDKVDLGLISDNDDDIELTQSVAEGFNKEVHGTSSAFTDRDMKLVKQDVAVSELDIQADLISQADSVEGNWGSVSVLSTFSDAQAATETGSQPSQESAKAEMANLQPKSNNGKSDIFQPSSYIKSVEKKAEGSNHNEGAPESQTSLKPQEHGVQFPSLTPMANELSGRKREEEIIAKVTNWSTGKPHMPLKSYLGESSPSAKDNPHPPISQETKNTVMHTKESVTDTVRGELGKEWNSPARYPANIKREKGKVRSRPLWAPFICCSSVQTS